MTAAPEWRLPGSPAHRDASIFAQHVPHLALLVFYQVNQVAATVASGGRPKGCHLIAGERAGADSTGRNGVIADLPEA